MVSLPACSDPADAARPTTALHSWQLGCLMVSRGAQPGCTAPSRGALLLIPVGQPLVLRPELLPRIPPPPLDLLFLPAGGTDLRAAPFEGWQLGLEVEPLCLLAAELAGHRLSPARFRRRLQQCQPLQLHQRSNQSLRNALLQLLQMGASPTLRQQSRLLKLDRMILRLVVLLLCGDLIDTAQRHAGLEPGHRTRVFKDLISWIEARLDQPIQLQDLVQQSGYSERSLRNFFRERFGCGPIQWIRSQRLSVARERLLNPQPEDSVGSIATALGYEHPSQFSRDFQHAFGSRPSVLLREGRRSQIGKPGRPEPLRRGPG